MLSADSVIIVWRSDDTTPDDPTVHYDDCHGTSYPPVTGAASRPASNPGVWDHTVTMTGLNPDTRYCYTVGGGSSHTNQFFTTDPSSGTPAPFRAWIVGDSGFADNNRQIAVREAMQAATSDLPPDLFLHVGDVDQVGGRDGDYTDRFFNIYNLDGEDILRHTPFWPTAGNHDSDYYANSRSGTRLPAENDGGYVTRYTEVKAGDDGQVRLSIQWGGTDGNAYKGKYASAVMLAEAGPHGFTAYNDLAWAPGQLGPPGTKITTITSPNRPPGWPPPEWPAPSSGELVDFTSGTLTGVTLTVTGGWLELVTTNQGKEELPAGSDAYAVFSNKVSCKGVISYVDAQDAPLELTFNGLEPAKTYELVFYGDRDNYGWDRASYVNLSGAPTFKVENQGPYYEAFALPKAGETGGIASGTEAYYSFDYANVHFIVLDSAGSDVSVGSPQLTWLQDDLDATRQPWIVAYWHHPPYTKGSHDSDDPADSDGRMNAIRENVLPILEAGGVDLVLSGHSHNYERSALINGYYGMSTDTNRGCQRSDGNCVIDPGSGTPLTYRKATHEGTVYVVAGHGGKIKTTNHGTHPVMVPTPRWQEGSCLMDINGSKLRFRNLHYDGTFTDEFWIQKGNKSLIPSLKLLLLD